MEPKIEHDGTRLRNYRVMKKITLPQAATLCGLSKSELSKLESGARPIRPDHIVRLAKVYSVTPLDLLTQNSKLRAFVEHVAERKGGVQQRQLPLFDGRQLATRHEQAPPQGKVACPIQLADIDSAYAVTITDMANAPALQPGVVLFVHPDRPPTINDLVINRLTWSPLVMYLRQSDDGDLYGLTLSKKRVDLDADDIDRLHKVVGIWMSGGANGAD
jgi:transcriptional regulator with XRE-family HTH domain